MRNRNKLYIIRQSEGEESEVDELERLII